MQNDLDRETAALQELEAQKQDAQDRLEEMDQQKHKLEDMLNEIRMKCQDESQMVIKGKPRVWEDPKHYTLTRQFHRNWNKTVLITSHSTYCCVGAC